MFTLSFTTFTGEIKGTKNEWFYSKLKDFAFYCNKSKQLGHFVNKTDDYIISILECQKNPRCWIFLSVDS